MSLLCRQPFELYQQRRCRIVVIEGSNATGNTLPLAFDRGDLPIECGDVGRTVVSFLQMLQLGRDDLRLGDVQELVVPFEVLALPILESVAPELLLGQAIRLDHRAHGAVEDQDPGAQQVGQEGGPGADPRHVAGIAATLGRKARIAENLPDAVRLARESGADGVYICGSVYLCGSALAANSEQVD